MDLNNPPVRALLFSLTVKVRTWMCNRCTFSFDQTNEVGHGNSSSVIPALEQLRQEDHKFQANWRYKVRHCLKAQPIILIKFLQRLKILTTTLTCKLTGTFTEFAI